jgi:hypothetical protein
LLAHRAGQSLSSGDIQHILTAKEKL